MPFKKGDKPKGHRAPGVPNKATADARAAIALFVDTNASRLQGWLDSIASDPKKGPEVAYRCVLDLLEYHVPKLARTELTGKDGDDLVVRFGIHTHTGPPPKKEDVPD